MGSKKHRKEKQEITSCQENTALENSKQGKKRKLTTEDSEKIMLINDEVTVPIKQKRKKKKAKLLEETALVTEEVNGEIVENGIEVPEVKDEEVLGLNVTEDIKPDSDLPHEIEDPLNKRDISMPQSDLIELLRRIEIVIPMKDNLSYKSRTDKLNWGDIVFSHYSVGDCKETWNLLLKKVRRYRILKEVVDDAKEFVLNPPKTKRNMYPGMPPKPPSSYQLFYKKKKPQLLAEIPGMEIGEISREISQRFKNLPVEKKAKYEKMSAELRSQYDKQLEDFYNTHPEIERLDKKKKEKPVDSKPRKPLTPFLLYYENQLRKSFIEDGDVQSKNTVKEQAKLHWKQLSLKKKVNWIIKAEQDITRYEDEVKIYMEQHPEFVPISVKHILTKEEMALKEKFYGKPDKPPTSAYSLFSRNLLQSDEIKMINVKERMNFISNQWKNCSEEERNKYKNKVNELVEQYKKDYEFYLNSLPEDKRQLEIKKNIPKKKTKLHLNDTPKKNMGGKGKVEKMKEPATPPISAFRYYANINSFENKVAKKAWRKLSDGERREYEKKLVEIKREYILEFEKFLNSLSKEELEEYSKTKQELKFNSDDFVDDSSSSSSESEVESDNAESDE